MDRVSNARILRAMRTPKRTIFASLAIAVLLPSLTFLRTEGRPAPAKNYLVYVGTYTTKTASKGIYTFRYDASSGKLTPLGVAAETPDPSWVAVHPSGKFLYSVNEAGKSSMVSAFAIDSKSGKLTLLNQLPALGEDPCYLSFDKTGKYVFVANYTSGNVVVFPIGPYGKLGAATANLRDVGTLGPNKDRQDGPHAHWVETTAGNHFVYVADLGLDRVLIYNFDATNGSLKTGKKPPSMVVGVRAPLDSFSATLNPGAGPRHVAFDSLGNFMYALGELNSTVAVFTYDQREREGYRPIQSVSTLPAGFEGRNDAAEIAIHPNAKFLYTSNRGHDSIALCHIDPASGKLTAAGDFSV